MAKRLGGHLANVRASELAYLQTIGSDTVGISVFPIRRPRARAGAKQVCVKLATCNTSWTGGPLLSRALAYDIGPCTVHTVGASDDHFALQGQADGVRFTRILYARPWRSEPALKVLLVLEEPPSLAFRTLCRLTPPSSGRPKGRFAPFGPPLMSNVRPHAVRAMHGTIVRVYVAVALAANARWNGRASERTMVCEDALASPRTLPRSGEPRGSQGDR